MMRGEEIMSGAQRIHDPALLEVTFSFLTYSYLYFGGYKLFVTIFVLNMFVVSIC